MSDILLPEHPKGSLHMTNIADEVAIGQHDLTVVVVSPARPLFSGPAHWVTVPGSDGQLGIWPRHADLVAALGAGPLRIGRGQAATIRFAVRGGFVKVGGGSRVTILVDHALAEADAAADADAARAELAVTVADLRHPGSEAGFADLLERRAWCQARMKLAGS